MMIADLRSDTVTKPTQAMQEAMWAAPLGDDVFGEDPSIQRLEEEAATMFGAQAGLFCPSGTMTNQIAIRVHCRPGDEVICSDLSHIYNYEGGGIAMNAGASVRLLQGDKGRITLQQIKDNINPVEDAHYARTKLVSIENTCNRGGGTIYKYSTMQHQSIFCRENGFKYHMDGARIFNALVESDYKAQDLGQWFDSISICLSKGLGCPVGSVLVGSTEFIAEARRARKAFGGGMRQAGMLAAAGSYALKHHVSRLIEDHQRAKALAEAAASCSLFSSVDEVVTNIVIITLAEHTTATAALAKLKENGILAVPFGAGKIRLVTHLDFCDDQLQHCVEVFKSL